MMHKKMITILGFGFAMGLGLASCATAESEREPASDTHSKYAHNDTDEGTTGQGECRVGEEKTEDGDCVRRHTFDRPFRRGGR